MSFSETTLRSTTEAPALSTPSDQTATTAANETPSQGLAQVPDQITGDDTASSSCCCCFTAIQSLFDGMIACICSCFRAIGETLCCLSPIDTSTPDPALATAPTTSTATSDEAPPADSIVPAEPQAVAPTSKYNAQEKARLVAFAEK